MNKYNLKYYCNCGKEICYQTATHGKGRCASCAKKGLLNPNYKDGLIINIHFCSECGKQLSRGIHTKCKSCSAIERFSILENCTSFGKHYSEKTKQQMRISHTGLHVGKLNGMWQGGISFLPYSSDWNESFKESIRDRDQHECQLCHKKEINLNRALDVHHIDYDKQNCKEDNLISLCLKCHLKTQSNRDYWFAYFTELIKSLTEKCECKT